VARTLKRGGGGGGGGNPGENEGESVRVAEEIGKN